jgi:hypothetical protein
MFHVQNSFAVLTSRRHLLSGAAGQLGSFATGKTPNNSYEQTRSLLSVFDGQLGSFATGKTPNIQTIVTNHTDEKTGMLSVFLSLEFSLRENSPGENPKPRFGFSPLSVLSVPSVVIPHGIISL